MIPNAPNDAMYYITGKYTSVMVQSGFKQCFSNGLSWLFLLGCLNLFLTTQLNHDANLQKERYIQLRTYAYIRLLNKPYVNEVTLRGQNPTLKGCLPLDFLYTFLKDLDLSIL